uniref:Uncharacterized protein n=1 Tax=Ciona intestinalis TaxID=7719 RepID=H2XSR5_CIOIN
MFVLLMMQRETQSHLPHKSFLHLQDRGRTKTWEERKVVKNRYCVLLEKICYYLKKMCY